MKASSKQPSTNKNPSTTADEKVKNFLKESFSLYQQTEKQKQWPSNLASIITFSKEGVTQVIQKLIVSVDESKVADLNIRVQPRQMGAAAKLKPNDREESIIIPGVSSNRNKRARMKKHPKFFPDVLKLFDWLLSLTR